MVRAMSFLLSFWLATLFVVGQTAHVPQLLISAIGVAALCALLGAIVAPMMSAPLRLGCSILLALGLFALAGVAFALRTPPWVPWCVIMGTFCFIGVAIAEVIWAPRNRGTMAPADA